MSVFYSHATVHDGTKEGTTILRDHLRQVGQAARNSIRDIPIQNRKILSDVAYIVGITHDLGKYMSYFQKYLLFDQRDDSNRHHHGFISALFAGYLVDKLVAQENTSRYLSLAAYLAVLHHHGHLRALELDVIKYRDLKNDQFLSIDEPWRARLKALVHQVKDLSQSLLKVEKDYEQLFPFELRGSASVGEFLQKWRQVIHRIDKLRFSFLKSESDQFRRATYIDTIFLYSALIDADKRKAAKVTEVQRRDLPANLVDIYRETDPDINTTASTGMNGIRNEIYCEATEAICHVSEEHRLFSLIAPTGTGKTLTSFSCALRLRERLNAKGYRARIIYSLPFTTIIDQNYNVVRKVLRQLSDFEENESAYLLKHHHLADIVYRVEGSDKPVDESLLLVESWEAEVIVTTFIQFLYSVIGFRNSFLKKYHNIAGSIILLDEVQNITVEYWPLVGQMLGLLTQKLGCYVILITATRPLIFDEKDTVSLIKDSHNYFGRMNRVKLIPDLTKRSVESLHKRFRELFDGSLSYLIVLNSIKSSIEFYDRLVKDDSFKTLKRKGKIFYLSTNIIPKDRVERIEKIKEMCGKNSGFIVVSTQVVEAGVNIDLDVVIRDIGPVDSIIQVAGRCNRSMGDRTGEVYVFHLHDGKASLAKYVYGAIHCLVARKLIQAEDGVLEEATFFNLVNRYFEEMSTRKSQEESKKIWDAVGELRFDNPWLQDNPKLRTVSDFQLIKEKGGYVDVYVEVDETAARVWQEYVKNVQEEADLQKRRFNYLSIRKDFRSYVVSVPSRLAIGLEPETGNLHRISNDMLEYYYRYDTGFKRVEDESTLMF